MRATRRKEDEDVHYSIAVPVTEAAAVDAFYGALAEEFQLPRRDVSRAYNINDITTRNNIGICVGTVRKEKERWLFVAVGYRRAQTVDEIAARHNIAFENDPVVAPRPAPPRYASRPRL